MKSSDILRDVAQTLEDVEKRINSLKNLSDKNKAKALRLLNEAKENFTRLAGEVVVDNDELANFFLKRAVKLKNSTTDKFIEKMGEKEYIKEVSAMNRYSKVAPYDFAGKVKELQKAYRAFLFGMIPFYIVSGIYGPAFAITALILVIPTLLSMISLRKRGSIGLMLALAVMPVPIVLGAFSVRYGIYALSHEEELMKIANAFHRSLTFAQGVAVLVAVLGALSITLLSYAAYSLYRHRHAFL